MSSTQSERPGVGFDESEGATRRGGIAVLAAFLVTFLGACDVTNPGPVQDEFLNDDESHEALVNGAGRSLVETLNWIGYTGALTAREIFPGGQTGAHGHSVRIQGGALPYDQVNTHWNNAQQARFIAEDAIDRFTRSEIDASERILAQAYIWAGYANRILGENMCEVVFDGGDARPSTAALERAEEHFTDALSHAAGKDQVTAARAGRAQVRLALGDWAGAASDAAEVPIEWELPLTASGVDTGTRNRIYWANADRPYRAFTIHFTHYHDYYPDTGDPRVAWSEDPDVPVANASLQGYGQVPWSFQTKKHDSENADHRLASGDEMRLIEAEAILNQSPGSWDEALDLINQVRTRHVSDVTGDPLAPWEAASVEETYTALMRERGIELWLEARRLGDLRRWDEMAAPGDVNLPDFESVSSLFEETPDARCFPIPEGEVDTNPNLGGG